MSKVYWVWDDGGTRDGPDDWKSKKGIEPPWFHDYKSDYYIQRKTLKKVIEFSTYEKLRDELFRHKNYLKNAAAPIYECRDCGAKDETFRSIEHCYKCKSKDIFICYWSCETIKSITPRVII